MTDRGVFGRGGLSSPAVEYAVDHVVGTWKEIDSDGDVNPEFSGVGDPNGRIAGACLLEW